VEGRKEVEREGRAATHMVEEARSRPFPLSE
jgi:hypothetical protein